MQYCTKIRTAGEGIVAIYCTAVHTVRRPICCFMWGQKLFQGLVWELWGWESNLWCELSYEPSSNK